MRIGIDCRTILNISNGERAGVGHYTYFLVKNLLLEDKKNEYVLFFDNRFKGVEEFKKYSNVTIKFFPFYNFKKFLPFVYSHILISIFLSKANLDIYHSPANIIPLYYNKKSIVTIHDLGIYKYPEFFPRKFLYRQSFSKKILVPNSLKKSTIIIAVSKSTKKDIIQEFKVSEEKIEIVYEGVLDNSDVCQNINDFEALKKKYGINDKYILFLGTIEPRKNIINLIKAFRSLRLVYNSPISDYQLIIAGNRGWSDQPIYKSISDANASILGIKEKRTGLERRNNHNLSKLEKRLGTERRKNQPIKYVGYVSNDEKMALLCKTTCFVFPSFYEGFGLPVLEAMSLQIPVITSDISSLPEITGTDAAILIDPKKDSEISEAIQKIITDKDFAKELARAGQLRSDYFSWKKCAKETIAIYNSIK